MIGDLHIHSQHSDGGHTIAEVLVLAKERGLSYLSIADVGTTAGTVEAIAAGARMGLTIVPGVEIPSQSSGTGGELHILGYGFRTPADTINALCLSELPTAAEAIRAIHADGGKAVLAHPGQLDSYGLVGELVAAGLDGIELCHPDHGPDDHRRVQALARQHDLFMTGGSDGGGVHGGYQEIGDIHAPFGALTHLLRSDNELVNWAEALVREAGAMARRAVLTEIETELKGGDIRDIVTEHDMAIDRFLTDSIRKRFPDHGFVTEEHEHPPVEDEMPAWIIDPIDGTTNFVSSHRYFAVSLAHYIGTRPVFGFVYDVMADDLYLGIAGKGSWLNGTPLQTNPKPMQDSVIETSLVCSKRLEERYAADTRAFAVGSRAQRAFGAAAIGICRIAAGTLDMYISCSLSLWDYAAAIIVLAEAGGQTAVEHPVADDQEKTSSESAILKHIGSSLIYHDRRHLFMAATGEPLLGEVTGCLFTGPLRPSLALLSPGG